MRHEPRLGKQNGALLDNSSRECTKGPTMAAAAVKYDTQPRVYQQPAELLATGVMSNPVAELAYNMGDSHSPETFKMALPPTVNLKQDNSSIQASKGSAGPRNTSTHQVVLLFSTQDHMLLLELMFKANQPAWVILSDTQIQGVPGSTFKAL
ncbi:hypothetical protein CTA2_7942 [Colletotrichum tanaceti]|nr:hypothetical protein CTA2_7942 [Colletotrichum tanaceti]